MASIFDLFRSRVTPESMGDTATVRKIVQALEALEPERARFVAAFAFLLGRVAHADLDISEEETAAMEEQVRLEGGLPEAQAVLAVSIAKAQNQLFGGTESFQVAREFKSLSTREERVGLLHCLFAVAAADDAISGDEEELVRQVADELGLSHREFADVRSAYNEKRTVLRGLDDR